MAVYLVYIQIGAASRKGVVTGGISGGWLQVLWCDVTTVLGYHCRLRGKSRSKPRLLRLRSWRSGVGRQLLMTSGGKQHRQT